MAPVLPRRARHRNQRRSDRLEVRGGVEEIVSRIVEDPVERTIGLDAEHLVDAAECEIMAAAGLVTPRVDEPWSHTDALYECRRLPRGRHWLPRRGLTEIQRRRRGARGSPQAVGASPAAGPLARARVVVQRAASDHAADDASSPNSGSFA